MKRGSKKAAELGYFTIILILPSNKDLLCASGKPPSLSEPQSPSAGGTNDPAHLAHTGQFPKWPWEA